MILYIISLLLFIIVYALVKATRISPDCYFYEEEKSIPLSIPVWLLLLAIIFWIIPILNIVASVVALFGISMFLVCEENVKLVTKEKTFLNKIIIFLTKEI